MAVPMLHPAPRIPNAPIRLMEPGIRVYAIGDIHGHYNLLQQMHQMIAADLAQRPCERAIELFLGDYIDRGPNPSEVFEHLMHAEPAAHERICLSGNHEKALLQYFDDAEWLMKWARSGALDTLKAYGVELEQPLTEEMCREAQPRFAANFPDEQKAFIEALPLTASFGDYFFVHAGIRPGIPFEQQDPYDLVWIRYDFLDSTEEHGKLIVHGHTPHEHVEIKPNRINIDTAAFSTGVLTCLVLEDDQQHLMATG